MARPNDPYTTESEKNFISKLGTGKFTRLKSSRLDLLKKYKVTLFKREYWEKLDFESLLMYVENQIEAEV